MLTITIILKVHLAPLNALLQFTIIPPMLHLPPAQSHLYNHTQKARNTYPSRITHTSRTQAELPILLGHIIRNLGKGTDIHQPTQQTFPENDDADDVVAWYEVEHCMRREKNQIGNLQKRWQVQVVDPNKGR